MSLETNKNSLISNIKSKVKWLQIHICLWGFILGDTKEFLLTCVQKVLVQLICLNQDPNMFYPFLMVDIL